MVNFDIAANPDISQMKPEKIRAILDQKMALIAKLSDKIAVDFDADAIHDFRTSTKSLRAFMRMLAVAKGDRFKLPGKYKDHYHIAGNIREVQLELEKIKAAQLYLPEYERHLKEVVSREKKAWRSKKAEKGVVKLKRKVKGAVVEKQGTAFIRNFINGRFTDIHNLCTRPMVTDDIVHSMRKLLKDVVYILRGVQKEQPGKLEDFDLARLDYCSQLLGDYNDARIMMERLHKFVQVGASSAESQRIQQLLGENTPKLESERKRIINEMLALTHEYATAGCQTGTVLQESIPGR